MSLITQSDQRNGNSLNQVMLRTKIEQAIVNEAIAMQDLPASSSARKAWAVDVQKNPGTAMPQVVARVILKTQIATNGGETNDNIIETEVRAALALIAPA